MTRAEPEAHLPVVRVISPEAHTALHLTLASSVGHGSLVVSSDLTSIKKTLFREKIISLCQKSDEDTLPVSPEIVENTGLGTYGPHTKTKDSAVLKGGRVF